MRLGRHVATEKLRSVSLHAEARARRDGVPLHSGLWSGWRFRYGPLCVKPPLRTPFRATAYREIVAVMVPAGTSRPQSWPKRPSHGFRIAVVTICVPLPSCAVVLGQAGIAATVIRSRRLLAWRRGLFGEEQGSQTVDDRS